MEKKNLVLSAATNYTSKDLKIFVKSLRKYYNDRVIMVISNNDHDLIKYLEKFSIEIYFLNEIEENLIKKNPKEISQLRYSIFYKILKNNFDNINKVLICDCRDIFFQGNCFDASKIYNLNFFLEEEIINNCARNSKWLIRTVGRNKFNFLKNNFISCSGTTLGFCKEMLFYLQKMCDIIIKYPYKRPFLHKIVGKQIKSGYDQGLHNYVIYNYFSNKAKFHRNQDSFICTTAWMTKFNFDKYNFLCNSNNEKYSLVHQYDKFKDVFYKTIDKIENY